VGYGAEISHSRQFNDRAYGSAFKARVRATGIRDRPTSFRSPWQNGYVERLIGSIRRECGSYGRVQRRTPSTGFRSRAVIRLTIIRPRSCAGRFLSCASGEPGVYAFFGMPGFRRRVMRPAPALTGQRAAASAALEITELQHGLPQVRRCRLIRRENTAADSIYRFKS
jgi:hypothetical protein